MVFSSDAGKPGNRWKSLDWDVGWTAHLGLEEAGRKNSGATPGKGECHCQPHLPSDAETNVSVAGLRTCRLPTFTASKRFGDLAQKSGSLREFIGTTRLRLTIKVTSP